MKKQMCLMLVIAVIALLCAGCGSAGGSNSSVAAPSDVVSDIEEVVSESSKPVEEASISSADALDKVQSLSMDKLGLEGKKDDYKFMISTKGKILNSTDCFEINASKEIKKNKDGTVHMQTVGQYFLTYDGKTIYKRDITSGEYIQIEP